MAKIITADEARELVSRSETRRNEVYALMDAEIRSQSEKGLKWASFPNGLNYQEKLLLIDSLTILGYRITNSENSASW